MQWFIDAYKEGTLAEAVTGPSGVTISGTGRDCGVICMPTGAGKSGMMFQDIIQRIDAFHRSCPPGKLVINVSSPYLKLAQQLAGDLLDVISGIYGDLSFLRLFCNSSDSVSGYRTPGAEKFEAGFGEFMERDDEKMALVVSCHRSLSRFAAGIAKYEGRAEFDTYIDECHMICTSPGKEGDGSVYVDLPELRRCSSRMYMFSATPDARIAWPFGGGRYIIQKCPKDFIRANGILPPLIRFVRGSGGRVDVGLLRGIMQDARVTNPRVRHKILVTAGDSDELAALRRSLEGEGFRVFSTCSRYGFGPGTDEYANITEFASDVDSYDGDCFVLHIRQLVQGADIGSLTDCVISAPAACGGYRNVLQTIGRVLRPAGERGMPIGMRTKKVGKAYIITRPGEAGNRLRDFLVRYYGPDVSLFEEDGATCRGAYPVSVQGVSDGPARVVRGEDLLCVQEVCDRIRRYIKRNARAMREIDRGVFGRTDAELAAAALEECDRTARSCLGLSERSVMDDSYFVSAALNYIRMYV